MNVKIAPMAQRTTSNPTLVATPAAFGQMMTHLATQHIIAVDTESDSLFSYYPKVCLIQITAPTDTTNDATRVTDYLVDPLRYHHLEPLGELFANPAYEVILHAAENDIMLLQREFGFSFSHVFDTQLAARILGWKQVGLAALLEEHFGVVTDKRMQRTNWGKRPLTPEQIAYAQIDTHYLPPLRALQIEQLKLTQRWEEAQDAFRLLAQAEYRDRPTQERTFWQMKESRAVPRDRTGVLEELWLWREKEAQRRNCPPFKIVNNQVLVDLALNQPAAPTALGAIASLSPHDARRYGSDLLDAIQVGRRRPLPPLPEPSVRPEYLLDPHTLARYDALRAWRSRTAEARGVNPDIVLTNEALLEIARRRPRTIEELQAMPAIGPWKARTYGPAIVELITH